MRIFFHGWLSLLVLAPALLRAQEESIPPLGTPLPTTPSMPRNDMPVRRLQRVWIYFPPNPPPLGWPVSPVAATVDRMPAPRELANYVSEFFYPALGTRLVTRTLNEKLRARLEAYREAKLALQSELRSQLDRLRSAEPAERLAELTAFARRQTPAIVELEKTAEQLRRDLIDRDQTWSAQRLWHLSDRERRGFSPLEIAQVMRSFAFYENGLLPAQRRLLREISIELQFASENTESATEAQPFMFFAPEPARVILPEGLSAEVAAKVAAYQTKKSALKKELYDAVHASDGAGFFRSKPIRDIAEQQAARLAELDTLAEEIRRGLQASAAETRARSPLPQTLDHRILAMVSGLREAQREAIARLNQIVVRSRDLPVQISYRFNPDGLHFVIAPRRGGAAASPEALRRIEDIRSELSVVSESYGRRAADIVNERNAIRQEIGTALSLSKREDIDRAFNAAARRAAEKEAEAMFSEYRIAVFEPGLSPEQRRLLFDGAVEQLALPLPRGELQPTERADGW